MRRKPLPLLVPIGLAGCAATPRSDVAPVPVYTPETMPCEYEVIGDVRSTTGATFTSASAFEEARDRALGREGAEMGADAVLVPDPRAGQAVRREVTRRNEPPPLTTFRGEGVRFMSATCRDRP